MRIVHKEVYKQFTLTFFKMEDRYTVKIEDGPLEQHYKLGQFDAETDPTALSQHLDAAFWQQVAEVFEKMQQVHKRLLPPASQPEEEFPTII